MQLLLFAEALVFSLSFHLVFNDKTTLFSIINENIHRKLLDNWIKWSWEKNWRTVTKWYEGMKTVRECWVNIKCGYYYNLQLFNFSKKKSDGVLYFNLLSYNRFGASYGIKLIVFVCVILVCCKFCYFNYASTFFLLKNILIN